MVTNVQLIETQFMFNEIEEIEDPKEALEKLATLELTLESNLKVEDVRMWAYGTWLKKVKKDEEWADYLAQSVNELKRLLEGELPEKVGEPPEGWIPPLKYFAGDTSE